MVRRQLYLISNVGLVAFLLALGLPSLASAQGKGKGQGKGQNKAAAKAEAQQVHQQVAALKKQKEATVHGIKGMFAKMISQEKLTEVELAEQRKHLIQERSALAGSAGSPEEKALVHQHFDSVIQQLGQAKKLDKAQIAALKKQGHEMVKNVEHQYNAAIKALEAKAKKK